jgi:hypothetical protein
VDRLYLARKEEQSRRPVIAIGPHIFQEAVCDFEASVNIMPKVIYEKILEDPLLYINMCLYTSHSATPREFLKMPSSEWDKHMFL